MQKSGFIFYFVLSNPVINENIQFPYFLFSLVSGIDSGGVTGKVDIL